jgi:hypothetical protein
MSSSSSREQGIPAPSAKGPYNQHISLAEFDPLSESVSKPRQESLKPAPAVVEIPLHGEPSQSAAGHAAR